MKAPECVDCGEKMLSAYMKSGLAVWLCPHTKLSKLNVTNAAIFCGNHNGNDQHKDSLVYARTRYPDAVKNGTDTESLRIAFDQLTKGTNLTLEKLKEATHDTASERALLEYANLSITLGLPVENLPELFNAAMKLGYALGRPTEYAIRSLAIGIGRQSYMVLDNIGVVFRSNEAREWFAHKHNLEKIAVSQYRQAWIEYAIKLVTEKAAKLEIAPQSKKAKVERLDARTKDGTAKLGVKVV